MLLLVVFSARCVW